MENKAHVELLGIRKAFGSCVAVEDVTLRVAKGSIHAIVGENGAGKSTAMKILYGQYPADKGEIKVNGVTCQWRSSADAILAGFGMVHQHFMLAGCHTAVENVLLAAASSGFSVLDLQGARTKLERLMHEFGMEVRLDLPVDELTLGEQQRVEILKLLYRDSEILILDEPTAVLAPVEIEALFATLRGMAKLGKTILIITHKLKEVIALADHVTVFRAGRVVGARAVQGASVADLAGMMVGREFHFEENAHRLPTGDAAVLELQDAAPVGTMLNRLAPVSFRLREREILGIAGVEGNGQTELIRLLLDPRERMASGQYRLMGSDVSRWSSARLREDLGLAIFPEDRLREALLLEASAQENFLLGKQRNREFRKNKFFIDQESVSRLALAAMREFDVRPLNLDATAGSFSGGNQQKIVVARELSSNPRFLLAAQPTRGVDIGAIEFIHKKIIECRNSGAGVLLVSSELDEVLKLSDRLLVLYRGRIAGSFSRADFDERKIGLLMAGGKAEEIIS